MSVSSDVRQVGVGIGGGQLAVNRQRFLERLSRLLHPVLVAVQIPQIVERHGDVRQVGVGIGGGQLAVNRQRFLVRLSRLLHPVLGAVQNPQIVERQGNPAAVGLRPCQGQASLVLLPSSLMPIQTLQEIGKFKPPLKIVGRSLDRTPISRLGFHESKLRGQQRSPKHPVPRRLAKLLLCRLFSLLRLLCPRPQLRFIQRLERLIHLSLGNQPHRLFVQGR